MVFFSSARDVFLGGDDSGKWQAKLEAELAIAPNHQPRFPACDGITGTHSKNTPHDRNVPFKIQMPV
jgi:hypothetical protein